MRTLQKSSPMKKRLQAGAVAFLVLTAGFLWWRWKQDELRRVSLNALQRLDAALRSTDNGSLLETLLLPASLQSRTPAEQTEFIRKALADEISPAGLAVLRRECRFGPLKEIFPQEAQVWAKQAGVKAEDCVAFRLEQNGQRCEVVLVRPSSIRHPASSIQPTFRILRCNNVAQMAESMANDEVRISNASGGSH